jgi:predicted Zn-dependent protease
MGLEAQEDKTASIELNAFFAEMDVPTAYPIKISVVRDNTVNAFALPGGRIVVFSALLDRVGSYPELAALLSHEFTHINNKHTTRSIFRKLGSKVFLALLFGRVGSVTAILVDHADNLKSQKYSRKLEKEADLEGMAILMQRKIDPKGFADLFSHLKESSPVGNLPEFLASHPDIDKRIAYSEEAGKNATVIENPRLQSIFDKIKNKQP